MSEEVLTETRIFDPNNKQWANDHSGFGYRMLQKMGWAPGKGLGANEDVKIKHIDVNRKIDSLGVTAQSETNKILEGHNYGKDYEEGLKLLGKIIEEKKIVEERNSVSSISISTTEVLDSEHSHYIPNKVKLSKKVSKYSKEDLNAIFNSGHVEEVSSTTRIEFGIYVEDPNLVKSDLNLKEYFNKKNNLEKTESEFITVSENSKINKRKRDEKEEETTKIRSKNGARRRNIKLKTNNSSSVSYYRLR